MPREMSNAGSLPFRADLKDYEREAETLFAALNSGDTAAAWRFKWLHPRFRGKSVDDVKAATLALNDAQAVVAGEYSFENWADLGAFTEAVKPDGPISQFEYGVEAVVSGD